MRTFNSGNDSVTLDLSNGDFLAADTTVDNAGGSLVLNVTGTTAADTVTLDGPDTPVTIDGTPIKVKGTNWDGCASYGEWGIANDVAWYCAARAVSLGRAASASLIAYDSAGDSAYNGGAGGLLPGINGGYGWGGGWTADHTFNLFVGSSSTNGTGDPTGSGDIKLTPHARRLAGRSEFMRLILAIISKASRVRSAARSRRGRPFRLISIMAALTATTGMPWALEGFS